MSNSSEGWIEVAKLFAEDREVEILCPECGKACLKSEEIALPSDKTVEKRIYCEYCGAENFMRLNKKF